MERGRDEQDTESAAQGAPHGRVLDVEVGYDEQSKVYYVLSSDIPGLNIETATFEALVEVAIDAAPDLMDRSDEPTRIAFKRVVDLISSDGR